MKKPFLNALLAFGFAAFFAPGGALAAPEAHTNTGAQLNAAQCDGSGSPVVNVTFKVMNDADSGVAGNAWAMDEFNKSAQVWAQPDGSYCALVKFEGQFVTNAGPSPNNTGTLMAGVKGTISGGYRATFSGTLAPTLKTNGNIGAYDYRCDLNFNCPGAFDWIGAYFPGYSNFQQPYWAWNYRAGNNGSWVNASTGNSGDITG